MSSAALRALNRNDYYFQWEDDQAINRYDRFGDGSDGPDPHEDDYPTSGPPSYVSQEDVTKVRSTILFFHISVIAPDETLEYTMRLVINTKK